MSSWNIDPCTHGEVASNCKTCNELEIYRLRLAGALMASEGANPLIFKEKDVLPEIRDCPTINSVLDLYEEKERCKFENEMLVNDNDELKTIIDTLAKEIAELKKLLESK